MVSPTHKGRNTRVYGESRMNTPTKVLFKALICLLKTSEMDCVKNPSEELRKAKVEYIESTVKIIEELIGD